MIRAAALIATLVASPVAAQQAFECDWPARADTIVEPWEENSRTFANGNVRIALLDTIEPAAAAFHLLILSPPYDEVGGRQCRILSAAPGMGFAGLDFPSLSASYDPAVGLIFTIGAAIYDGDQGVTVPAGRIRFTLNQASGNITAGWQ